MITGSSDEDPERERELVLLFCERRVDGLLIVPAGEDHRLLSLSSPPTAIFAATNGISIGVLRALAACRADLEVVGFDDIELAELLPRSPTTVSYDAAGLGRGAAALLAARLEGDARPPQRVILPTELVVRGAQEVAA